jgi:hypothetical protein
MSLPKVPGWAIRALQELMVKNGIMAYEALKQTVTVPVDCMVPDGFGGKRQAMAGEKHPLSSFMCRRTAYNIAHREDTQRMLRERSEAHRREMSVEGEKLDRLLAKQYQMMAQGVRPVLNEVGEAKRDKNGKQLVERLPPAVHVQALGGAGALAARLNPAAQRVEMEHSGKIELTDLETARAARIAREAELAALLAAKTADE